MSENEIEMPLAVNVCIDILSNLNSYRLSVILCEFIQKLDNVIHNANLEAGIAKLNIETGNDNLKQQLITSIMANFENVDIERVQFKKILAQFNDMYGRLNAIEDVVSRIKPPPKENPAKLKDVIPKHISEQLKDCLSECKVLSEQLRNTVNTFAEFKADVYKKVEELNNKYENDLKQIRSDVTYKIADLKREITKQGLNNE